MGCILVYVPSDYDINREGGVLIVAFKKKIKGRQSRYYYVDFWIGDKGSPGAIHVNRSTKSANYDEACKIEDTWKSEAEERYFKGNGAMATCADDFTLQQALDHTWESKWSHNKKGMRPKRQIEYIIELIGDVPLSQLSGNMGFTTINNLRNQMLGMENNKGRAIKHETVDRYMSGLKTLLNTVQRDFRLYDDLIIPHVYMFNKKRARSRLLSGPEEVKLFKLMAKDHPAEAQLFTVLLDTGMRLSEGLTMTYQENIFLEKKMITIRGDHMSIKNSKARSVPLTKRSYDILRSRKFTHPERPFPWRQDTMSHLFRSYSVKMGFGNDVDFTPHMLRHTCTTRLLAAGLEKPFVQAWLGHSAEKMTDHYGHLVVEDIRGGAELLDTIYEKNFNTGISQDKPKNT
jgi:integrase